MAFYEVVHDSLERGYATPIDIIDNTEKVCHLPQKPSSAFIPEQAGPDKPISNQVESKAYLLLLCFISMKLSTKGKHQGKYIC